MELKTILLYSKIINHFIMKSYLNNTNLCKIDNFKGFCSQRNFVQINGRLVHSCIYEIVSFFQSNSCKNLSNLSCKWNHSQFTKSTNSTMYPFLHPNKNRKSHSTSGIWCCCNRKCASFRPAHCPHWASRTDLECRLQLI